MQTTIKLINPIRLRTQAQINDPYPLFRALRETDPVWWCKETKSWVVSTYNESQLVLRSPDFEKQIQRWKYFGGSFITKYVPQLRALSETSTNWLLNLNPPDHTRVRNVIAKAFAPSTVQALAPEIERVSNELIQEAKRNNNGEPIEFVSSYAAHLPLAVIGIILGIPISDADKLKKWSNQMVAIIGFNRSLPKLMNSGEAIIQLRKYLAPEIEQRRREPKDDLLSMLIRAEEEGEKLNTMELIGNLILLLLAGHETTSSLISSAMLSLGRNPEQLELLRSKPELCAQAVVETLRYESPGQAAPRLANKATEIGGKKIAEGDLVWVLLGSGNRDPEQFNNPDVFDITRPAERNLAFSDGIHRCLGATLAELEAQIAIESLLKNFSNIELVPDRPVNFRTPFTLRGPSELYLSLS